MNSVGHANDYDRVQTVYAPVDPSDGEITWLMHAANHRDHDLKMHSVNERCM